MYLLGYLTKVFFLSRYQLYFSRRAKLTIDIKTEPLVMLRQQSRCSVFYFFHWSFILLNMCPFAALSSVKFRICSEILAVDVSVSVVSIRFCLRFFLSWYHERLNIFLQYFYHYLLLKADYLQPAE